MKIGFINGCFDILHVGHLRMFNCCKKQVDTLIVAIDSDDRIRKSKGASRPINCLADRVEMLENIKPIDEVLFFSSDEQLQEIVKKIQPDIMMVGEEYRNQNVIGSEFAKKLIFFRRIDEYSTTRTAKNIISGR